MHIVFIFINLIFINVAKKVEPLYREFFPSCFEYFISLGLSFENMLLQAVTYGLWLS